MKICKKKKNCVKSIKSIFGNFFIKSPGRKKSPKYKMKLAWPKLFAKKNECFCRRWLKSAGKYLHQSRLPAKYLNNFTAMFVRKKTWHLFKAKKKTKRPGWLARLRQMEEAKKKRWTLILKAAGLTTIAVMIGGSIAIMSPVFSAELQTPLAPIDAGSQCGCTMIAPLAESLQEQRQLIDQLMAENASLNSRLGILENN
jgi:hypothetical protein